MHYTCMQNSMGGTSQTSRGWSPWHNTNHLHGNSLWACKKDHFWRSSPHKPHWWLITDIKYINDVLRPIRQIEKESVFKHWGQIAPHVTKIQVIRSPEGCLDPAVGADTAGSTGHFLLSCHSKLGVHVPCCHSHSERLQCYQWTGTFFWKRQNHFQSISTKRQNR